MPFAELPGELRMHYEDDYLGDPWKTPETVILQHGQAKAAWAWYAWVPLLGRDYRVIRVDARGYGQSSVPPADYQWSLERFAGDLTNLMDHLGIGRAHVIGDTIGGAIALTLAYLHPERLLTVATCQSTFKIAGVGYYQEYVRIVREQGVEAWIRWNDRQADT